MKREREMHLGGMADCKWMDGYQFVANGGLSNERKAGGRRKKRCVLAASGPLDPVIVADAV